MTKPTLRQITARTQARAAQAERERDIELAIRRCTTASQREILYDMRTFHLKDWTAPQCAMCGPFIERIRSEFHRIQNQRAAKPKG